ncbi:uncharacterized protein [Procambarus clarkii]|uniref:uncharacterized protein n=1 Tax=Procambarus clarkii TaxID=6728 RepID=UPI003742201A
MTLQWKMTSLTFAMITTVRMITILSTKEKTFRKMNIVYPDMSDCFLGQFNISTKIGCGVQCLQWDDCSLFCLTGGGCELYNARVSWHYTGVGGSSGTPTMCYSSWGSVREAAHLATITGSSAIKGTNVYMPVNGFYCITMYSECYLSDNVPEPFWMADLGALHRITSVRVQIRKNQTLGVRFSNVEARVGNSTTIPNNLLLGFFPGPASQRQVVTFTANTFITGSVVSLQSFSPDYFSVCSVHILYV